MTTAPAERKSRASPAPAMLVTTSLVALVLLGLLGVTSSLVFEQPTLLKYAASVMAPAFLLVVLNSSYDVILPWLALAVAPSAALGAGLGGLQVSVLDPVLFLAVLAMLWTGGKSTPGLALSLSGALGGAVLVGLVVPLSVATDKPRVIHLLVAMIAIGWCSAQLARRRGLLVPVSALLVGATSQAAIGVYEFVRGAPLNFYGEESGGLYASDYFFSYGDVVRVSAVLPDPISFGNVLALSCPLFVAAFFATSVRRSRLLILAAGALVGVALLLTLSRASWVAAVAGVLATTLLLKRTVRLRALGALVVLGMAIFLGASALLGENLMARLTSILDPTSSQVATSEGDLTRLQLQEAALQVGLSQPWVGVGLGNLPDRLLGLVPDASLASHAHSTPLNLFAETGVLGLIPVACFLVVVTCGVFRRARSAGVMAAGVFGSLLAIYACWMTDYTLRLLPVAVTMAVVLGLGCAMSSSPPRDREPRDVD